MVFTNTFSLIPIHGCLSGYVAYEVGQLGNVAFYMLIWLSRQNAISLADRAVYTLNVGAT